MKRPLILLLLTATVGLGAASAQGDDAGHDDHTTHDDHATHDHEAAVPGSGGNLFELGDRRYALLPLVAKTAGGYSATLVLTLAEDRPAPSDAGATAEGHDHAEGDSAAADPDAASEHDHAEENAADPDHTAENAAEHDHAESAARLTVALLDPSGSVAALSDLAPSGSGAATAYSLAWFDEAPLGSFDGVWRLSVADEGGRVEVPIAVATAVSDTTDLVVLFAPAPSLSGAGRTETFIYAYRELDPVHAAISLQRAMAGMQHTTDDERIALIHDHFVALAEIAPVGDAMANRSELAFAMAGTWQLTITIEGEVTETFVLPLDVLAE